MLRLLPILLLALIIALPFALRPQTQSSTNWKPGDPTLVIVTPHNEAIRYEFEQAFSRWHQAKHGRPVKIDWRSVGGTTEIMRFLASEYAAAARNWWSRTHKKDWPANATDALTSPIPPSDPKLLELWTTFRNTDNSQVLTARLDLFFGGGEFDHSTAFKQGLTVPPWKPGEEPQHLFYLPLPPEERRAETHEGTEDEARVVGQRIQITPRAAPSTRTLASSRPAAAPAPPTRPIASRPAAAPPTRPLASPGPPQPPPTIPDPILLIPERLSGETWRTPYLFGNVISTFGLCYNHDRLKDLNISSPPTTWDDLANPAYFQQVGAADPTKSGSVAKAFEMIIHQKIYDSVRLAGFTDAQIPANERIIDDYKNSKGKDYQRGDVPPDLQKYQDAIEQGWEGGLRLVQLIGANARYFTDSSQKVPIDVAVGDAAVGMSIDFYARYQAQTSKAPDGADRMTYVTPKGGSSVACDPMSLLRGAPNRQLAERFIEFTLSEEGQKLWCYKPGAPGGPEKYYLRRLPIRQDFYPSTNPTLQKRHQQHLQHSADNLADPQINPYALAETFTYNRRWTSDHFSIQRELVKVMAMDSGEELKEAWQAIKDNGGPANNPKAMEKLHALPTITLNNTPVEITWRTAPDLRRKHEPMDLTREWTKAFRQNYREAKQLAQSK